MSSDTIKVVVRAKPLLSFESKSVPWIIENNTIYQKDESNTVVGEYYTYDKVFDVDKKNVDIFKTSVFPMVQSALEGINLTIFAYGATSSGKTYTMNGTSEDPGVIPRIIEEIFEEIQMCNTRKFLLRVSYVEIYSEIINDLLDKSNKDLKIREDINNYINYNPTEKIIKSCQECFTIMKMGTANRTTGETLMNTLSSRSHSIFRIIIESTPSSGSEHDPVKVSQVNLIDLAGSERVSQTGATGQRFKEGAHINKSLTVLGLVISQLVEKRDYISYRDSKLTRILSNSLGGNAETIVICNINLLSIEDTQSTLSFAQRAKSVKVRPKVTEILNELSLTKRYAKECADLKKLLDAELEKNKQLEREREMSNTEISNLTSRIQSMQEIFVKKEKVTKPPRRRHTFCSILSSISEEKESGTILRNAGFTEKEISDMQNSIQCETFIQSDNSMNTIPHANTFEGNDVTPVKSLRERLRILSCEYDELREFTRFEKSTRLSIEQDMAQKFKKLTEECSNLRTSLEYAEDKIQAFILEEEKSRQLINDYEYLIESQKKRYEKRETELLDQINEINSTKISKNYISNENIMLHTPHINTFEHEEMLDTIESLKKQNEELHSFVESLNSQYVDLRKIHELDSLKNERLQEENKSLHSLNLDLQNIVNTCQSEIPKLNDIICALQLEETQLKIMNKSLKFKCLDFELAQENLSTKNSNIVRSLEKEICELKNKICELESDMAKVKIELNDSLDKLLEVTEDLDLEEKKCSELQKQLEKEKKLRKEAEIKLEDKEHFAHTVRRFSSDSLIHQKCKSFDSNILNMLFELKTILDPKSYQRIETSTDFTNFPQESPCLPRETENNISDNSPKKEKKNLSQNLLCIDLEKLKSFSSCYFEDSKSSTEFMSYFQSVLGEESNENVSIRTNRESDVDSNKRVYDPLNEIEKLKDEINSMKLKWQTDVMKISMLQKQLDDYNCRNLSDSEKIEKTNESSANLLGTFESLQAEQVNYHILLEKLECENASEKSKYNKLQEMHNANRSEVEEKCKEIELLSEKYKNLSNKIAELEYENANERLKYNKLLETTRTNRLVPEEENQEIGLTFSSFMNVSDIVNCLEGIIKSQCTELDDETRAFLGKCAGMLEKQSYRNQCWDKIQGLNENNISLENVNQAEKISFEDNEEKSHHSSDGNRLNTFENNSLLMTEDRKEKETIINSKAIPSEETLDTIDDMNSNRSHITIDVESNYKIYIRKALSLVHNLKQEIKLLNIEKANISNVNITVFDENIVENSEIKNEREEHEKLIEELENLKYLLKDVLILKKEHSEQKQIIQTLEIEKSAVLQSLHEKKKENEILLQETENLNTLLKNELEMRDRRLKLLDANVHMLEQENSDFQEKIRDMKFHLQEKSLEKNQQASEDICEKNMQIVKLSTNIEELKNENNNCLLLIESMKIEKRTLEKEKLAALLSSDENSRTKNYYMKEIEILLQEIETINALHKNETEMKDRRLEELNENLRLLEQEKSDFQKEVHYLKCCLQEHVRNLEIIDQANEDICEKNTQLVELSNDIEELKNEKRSLLSLMENMKTEKQTIELEKSAVIQSLHEKSSTMNYYLKENGTLLQKIESLNALHKNEIEMRDQKLGELTENLCLIEKEKNDFQKEIQDLKCHLQEHVKKNDNMQLVYEEKKELLEKSKNERIEMETVFRNQINNLQSQIDILKKKNEDLTSQMFVKEDKCLVLNADLEKMKESNENIKLLMEKEKENSKVVKTEIENINRILVNKLESEKQELQRLFDVRNKNLLSQIDSLNKKIEDFKVDIEKKEAEIENLTSKMLKLVSEKDSTLQLIKKIENEKVEMEEKTNKLIRQLDISEKSNCDLRCRISNIKEEHFNGQLIDKMYEEIIRLKEILPKDELKKPGFRELIIKHRAHFSNKSKLEEIKYLVDQVNSLVQERNMFKHKHELGYGSLVQIQEDMKRQLELKNRQHDILLVDLETLKSEHSNLHENYKDCKSEVKETNSALAKMKSKLENYKIKIENLTFENQNLAKKLNDMEELLKLVHKDIEPKMQSSNNENKALADKLHESEKLLLNYKKMEEKVQHLAFENRKLVDKINQFENKNRQFVECDLLKPREKLKENTPKVLDSFNRNSEVIERKEYEILKHKYEQLRKTHKLCEERYSEIEATNISRKENKWKQQRTEIHDSRRSIDLNTLCLESVVDTCNNCENMNNQLQKTKSEMLQLRKQMESMGTSELESLKGKYYGLKKLCRIRNDEIAQLQQKLLEMK